MEVHNGVRYLRAKDLVLALGVTRRTILTWVKKGQFPAPIQVGGKLYLWNFAEYEAWCNGAGAPK